MTTMKAAVVPELAAKLEIRELSVPAPGPGQVLMKMDVFALHAAGRTRVIAEPRQLQDVNACFDEVLAGHVPARLVFTFLPPRARPA
jgi:hypothetical protein